jgi:hypothetical protein
MSIELLSANQIVQIHFSEALYRNLTEMLPSEAIKGM